MNIIIPQHNQQTTQNLSIFADLPHDLFTIIVPYTDCKTMAAWKQTCHRYNNTLHYHQIPTIIIEHEDYNMITDGLMYIAEIDDVLEKITYGFRNFNINDFNELSFDVLNPSEKMLYSSRKSFDKEQTNINLKNFEKFLHNNSTQRISDLKMLGWKDHPSLENDINAFIKTYKGMCGPHLTSFSYSELPSDVLKRIIHVNPNKKDKDHLSPLVTACKNNNVDLVELLLANPRTEPGIENNISGKSETALSIAYKKGHTKIIQLLLAHKPTKKHNNNALPHMILDSTLLHQVCNNGHVKTVKLLLTFPEIDPNLQDNFQDTALHIACRKGHTKIVKLLLNNKKTDPNIIGLFSKTPIEVARDWKHAEIVQLLLAHPNKKDENGNTPLHQACLEGDIIKIKSLLNNPRTNLSIQNNNGETALDIAHTKGHIKIKDFLLTNIKSNDGNTRLHQACIKGHSEEVKRLLTFKEIDPNIQNNKGNTALLIACKNGNTEVVKLLLTHPNINIDIYNDKESTALGIAYRNKYDDIKKLLVLKKIHQKLIYYTPRVIGITLLALLLNYFFYATQNNVIT